MRSSLVTALMVGCALTVTGLAVRNVTRGEHPQRLSGEAWAAALSEGRWIGDSSASVRIVEFSDFQCPFCSQIAPRLGALVQSHGGRVAVLYRHFPLTDIHKNAIEAALAAECAGQQQRFTQMHDALFEFQDSIGVSEWNFFVRRAQIPDPASFTTCLATQGQMPRVQMDLTLARKFALPGTPVLMVEGRVLVGRQTDKLEAIVGALVKAQGS